MLHQAKMDFDSGARKIVPTPPQSPSGQHPPHVSRKSSSIETARALINLTKLRMEKEIIKVLIKAFDVSLNHV